MQEITKGIDHVQDSVKLVEKCKTGFCPPSEILKDEDPLAKQKTHAVKHGKGGMETKKNRYKMSLIVISCTVKLDFELVLGLLILLLSLSNLLSLSLSSR